MAKPKRKQVKRKKQVRAELEAGGPSTSAPVDETAHSGLPGAAEVAEVDVAVLGPAAGVLSYQTVAQSLSLTALQAATSQQNAQVGAQASTVGGLTLLIPGIGWPPGSAGDPPAIRPGAPPCHNGDC